MSDLEAEASPEASHESDVLGLPRSEVRRRSLAGVFYLTASSFANLLIGFFASLVLARMLTPSDFGVVAIGSTATLIGGALADGGLGAGMIRRPEPPTRSELRTLNGIQLALALAFCLPAVVDRTRLRSHGSCHSDHDRLDSDHDAPDARPHRALQRHEVRPPDWRSTSGLKRASRSSPWSAVVLGAGVWGLATGSIVKAVVGTLLTAALSIGFNAPSLRGWRGYGGLVRFGLKYPGELVYVGRA